MIGHVPFLSEISKEAPAAGAEGDKLGLPVEDGIPSGAVREGSPPKASTSTAFLTRPTLCRRRRAFQGCFQHRREHFPRRSHCDGNLVLRVTPEVEASAGTRGSSTLLKVGANAIDLAVDAFEKETVSGRAYTTLKPSNAGNVTASNTLGSSTDVFIRLIHMEGVIPSSSVTLAWCTRIERKPTAQPSAYSNLSGLTKEAKDYERRL